MSKIVAGTAFVLLSGATVTGGVLLLNKGSESVDADLPENLDKFKQEGHKEGCVKSLFPGLESTAGATTATATETGDFLGANTKTTGCLVVNWQKWTKTENSANKWRGNIRFLWAVRGGDKGFMIFLHGETPSADNKKEVQWKGMVYSLANAGNDGSKKWTAEKRHEVAADKAFKKNGSNAQDDHFPRPGTDLKTTGENPTSVPVYWGWMSGNSDLDNISTTTDIPTGQPPSSTFKGYWEWSGKEGDTDASTTQTLDKWTQNFSTWWQEIAGTNTFPAPTITQSRKGEWTAKLYEPVAATQTSAQQTQQ